MELVHDGKTMLMISRRKTPAITDLGPNQLQYLLDRGWIDRRRVQRLADHERASAEVRNV